MLPIYEPSGPEYPDFASRSRFKIKRGIISVFLQLGKISPSEHFAAICMKDTVIGCCISPCTQKVYRSLSESGMFFVFCHQSSGIIGKKSTLFVKSLTDPECKFPGLKPWHVKGCISSPSHISHIRIVNALKTLLMRLIVRI